jgi:integrase
MIKVTRGEVRKRSWIVCDEHGRPSKPCCRKGHTHSAWGWSLNVDGKQIRKQGFASESEAQDALDAFRVEQLAPPPPKAMEFGVALNRVLDLKTRSSTATRRDYKRIAQHLKSEFGAETPVSEITAAKVAEYDSRRLAATRKVGDAERPLSLAAINRPRAFLRHVLRMAQEWGVLASVPKIRLAKEKGRLRWLKPEEAVRLLDACRKSGNKALLDLVEFALFTGVRQSEAITLTWERADRATATVLLVDTKNGDPRTVHLNARADAVLARRWSREAAGYVFGSANWNSYRSAWETALCAARIENFRFHDLRHTFASWAVQRGVKLQEVKDLLGHKSLAMTLRYAHLAPENLRAAVSTLDGVLPMSARASSPVISTRKAHELVQGTVGVA